MWGFAKFVLFGLIAILVGIAAVSLPIGGATPAEHVQRLLGRAVPEEGSSPKPRPAPARQARTEAPAARAPADRSPERGAPSPAADRPPADELTDEDRRALERLLDEKMR